MDMVDFQEKMDPTHRMYLCRMLNVKNLSEDLLERYAQVKRLVDRIDGHLTPGDLAMIIMSVRFNPEIATELLDESDDKVIEQAVEQPVEPEEPGGDEAMAAEQEAEQRMAERPANDPMEPEQPTPKEGKPMLWSPGMPVNVLHKEELKQGNIVGVSRPSDVGKQVGATVKLTVEFEGGETETFDEDEVEAV